MKLLPLSGILLAFGASYGLTGFLVPRPASPAMGGPSAAPPAKATKSVPARITPRDLLTAADATPMSAINRFGLSCDLYERWAASDPLGMLASLNGKALPETVSLSSAFATLAATRPADLLLYAREQGCPDAVDALLDHGDPRQTLTTLLANTPYSYPADIYEKLFKQGEKLDPEFHRRIAELPDVDAQSAAFSAAAEVMLENKRHDDYFALLAEYPALAKPDDLDDDFAEIVLSDPPRLAQFSALPEEAQSGAIDKLVSRLDSLEDSGQMARKLLPEYARRGWLDERHATLLDVMMPGASDDDVASGEAWKDWALALPADGSCDYLRQVGVARWAAGEAGKERRYESLPTAELQDAARLGAVMSLADQENYPEAKVIAGSLHNAALREKIMLAVQGLERNEEVGSFDPFAPLQDAE